MKTISLCAAFDKHGPGDKHPWSALQSSNCHSTGHCKEQQLLTSTSMEG